MRSKASLGGYQSEIVQHCPPPHHPERLWTLTPAYALQPVSLWSVMMMPKGAAVAPVPEGARLHCHYFPPPNPKVRCFPVAIAGYSPGVHAALVEKGDEAGNLARPLRLHHCRAPQLQETSAAGVGSREGAKVRASLRLRVSPQPVCAEEAPGLKPRRSGLGGVKSAQFLGLLSLLLLCCTGSHPGVTPVEVWTAAYCQPVRQILPRA